MAKSLERDPQVESILRNYWVKFGSNFVSGAGVGRELADMIGLGRNCGINIGM